MTSLPSALLCLFLTIAAHQPAGPGGSRSAKQTAAAVAAYQKVLDDYTDALAEFQKAFERATTDEERQKCYAEKHPQPATFAPRFLAVANRFPGSPIAAESLIWVVTHPVRGDAPEAALRGEAMKLLQTDYLDDERVGRLCTQLVYTLDAPSEAFLRAVLAKSPRAAVQARACVSLAANLKQRGRLIRMLKDDATAVKEHEAGWGKPLVAALLARDPDRLLAESEQLFTRVIKQHGEEKHPLHDTLGDLARAHLGSIRQPVDVGRPAPEIDRPDLDGKRLRLSELRGKVVLLDFWGHTFTASRAMVAYQRGLVQRLAGKPFVLVGVNADHDATVARRAMRDEKLSWRSWHDGGTGGPIATRWEIDLWPSLVLLDHQGVVRGVWLGWPQTKKLDEAIHQLVEAAARAE